MRRWRRSLTADRTIAPFTLADRLIRPGAGPRRLPQRWHRRHPCWEPCDQPAWAHSEGAHESRSAADRAGYDARHGGATELAVSCILRQAPCQPVRSRPGSSTPLAYRTLLMGRTTHGLMRRVAGRADCAPSKARRARVDRRSRDHLRQVFGECVQ